MPAKLACRRIGALNTPNTSEILNICNGTMASLPETAKFQNEQLMSLSVLISNVPKPQLVVFSVFELQQRID